MAPGRNTILSVCPAMPGMSTGQLVHFNAIDMVRSNVARPIQHWGVADILKMLRQLNVVPVVWGSGFGILLVVRPFNDGSGNDRSGLLSFPQGTLIVKGRRGSKPLLLTNDRRVFSSGNVPS